MSAALQEEAVNTILWLLTLFHMVHEQAKETHFR